MFIHGQRLQVCSTQKTEAATTANQHAAMTIAPLNERCWDSNRDHYTYLYGAEQSPDTTLSVGAILPLILARTPKDQIASVMERYFTDVKLF